MRTKTYCAYTVYFHLNMINTAFYVRNVSKRSLLHISKCDLEFPEGKFYYFESWWTKVTLIHDAMIQTEMSKQCVSNRKLCAIERDTVNRGYFEHRGNFEQRPKVWCRANSFTNISTKNTNFVLTAPFLKTLHLLLWNKSEIVAGDYLFSRFSALNHEIVIL